MLAWSSGGPRKRTSYDLLRRVEAVRVQPVRTDEYEALVVKNRYGESFMPDPEAKKLRGQLYQGCDQSGAQTNIYFDFKGNYIESSIQYTGKYDDLLDWSEEVNLAASTYRTTSTFDAVGHTLHTATAGGQGINNIFEVAGRPRQVNAVATDDGHTHTSHVDNIEYSEGDEVMLIEYGNGSRKLRTYHLLTRRLARTSITLN
ncbi:uncharacterized protein ATNIH1004_011790 [Aspergillus tanneri]|nr:uncharacterized protein ATNIH1004_011790 [Aspergillus tanneri]KAA8641654.1 hypothetical protein ATNIH1004_011790 [Aspergillus tanneri]